MAGDIDGLYGAGCQRLQVFTRARGPELTQMRSAHGPAVYDGCMSSDDGMRVVGTIRSIELHTLTAKFQSVTARQVAKIQLDIERATDENGVELDIRNLADLQFQGPPELGPRVSA